MSGEPDGLALKKLGGAVFGLGFSTANDLLSINFRVNPSCNSRGKPTGEDLTLKTLYKLDDAVITKKTCLRVISSQYDPLGIAAGVMIILKVKMKDLYKLGVDWDTPLEGSLRLEWIKLFQMLVLIGTVTFKRGTKPEGAVGKIDW